jgi:hypothetical protein
MTTQGILIDVPRTTAPKRTRKDITAFKKANGILTHHFTGGNDAEERWMAVKVPPRRLDDGGPIEGMTLYSMCENFCRLLDDGGWTAYARGELSAVRALCEKRKIECPL